MARAKRDDTDYEIESLSKALRILEALEGSLKEPLTMAQIIKRTDFSRDICDRSLRTLRLNGYAIQDLSGKWMIGKKIIRFAQEF